MNADQVVEKILADAQAQADEISKKSQDEISKLNDGYRSDIENYKQETQQMASYAAQDKNQRMMAAARMDAAKQELETKRQIINSVFDKAAKMLIEMDEDTYLSLVEKLITKAVDTGDETIVLAEGEKKITSQFVKELNRKLGNGYKGNLKISEQKCKGKAGFILKRGNISTNVTLDVLLEQARAELEIKISNELFG